VFKTYREYPVQAGGILMRLTLAAVLALALAVPAAAQDNAWPAPLTSLTQNPPQAALQDVFEASELGIVNSMLIDNVAVTLLNVHGVGDQPLPPEQYRHYRGRIEVVEATTEDGQQNLLENNLVAITRPPMAKGEPCTVFTWPPPSSDPRE
jgi:hypothetical protein